MTERYGNLSLGQVSKLLVSIIGRDAALAINELAVNNGQSVLITSEDLTRIYKEEDRSYSHSRPSEKTSVMELHRQFLDYIEKEYAVPVYVGEFIRNFCKIYLNALRGKEAVVLENNLAEAGLIPYEMQTSEISLLLLNWSLGYLGYAYENGKVTISKASILLLFG